LINKLVREKLKAIHVMLVSLAALKKASLGSILDRKFTEKMTGIKLFQN